MISTCPLTVGLPVSIFCIYIEVIDSNWSHEPNTQLLQIILQCRAHVPPVSKDFKWITYTWLYLAGSFCPVSADRCTAACCLHYSFECGWREPAEKDSPAAWSSAEVSYVLKTHKRTKSDLSYTLLLIALWICFHTVNFTGAVHKVCSWPKREASQSRLPFTTPSHFPSDRKQGTVFLYKLGFTAGKRKSLLAKVSLWVSNY